MITFLRWKDLKGEVCDKIMGDVNKFFKEFKVNDMVKETIVRSIDFGNSSPQVEIIEVSDKPKKIRIKDGENEKEPKKLEGGMFDLLSPLFSDGDEKREYGGMETKVEVSNPPTRICSFSRKNPRFRERNRKKRTNDKILRKRIEDKIWRATDVSLRSFVSFVSDMRMSMDCVFQINEPVPEFITLPIGVTVSDLKFIGTSVLSYWGNEDRIQFYFEKSPLKKDFQLEVTIGEKDDSFFDKEKIKKFMKRNLDLFFEEKLIYPNFISQKGIGEKMESEIRKFVEIYFVTMYENSKDEGKTERDFDEVEELESIMKKINI